MYRHNKDLIVDVNDEYLLERHKFRYDKNQYPRTKINKKDIFLHHLILPKKQGFEIDHINRNKLDNRRCNLRYVTRSQNAMNHGIQRNNKSGYRGVTWCKTKNKWRSTITFHGDQIGLGYFDDVLQAAKIYQIKAKELFGEYLGEVEKKI